MTTWQAVTREFEWLYPSSSFKQWKAGQLHSVWFKKFPDLFDTDDLRLAQNQHEKGYHFGEWFTAIRYHERGYRVLQTKYANPKHAAKHAKALSLLRRRDLLWLWKRGRPDLLVYRRKRFFFVEVKRDRDRISRAQKRRFRQIEKRFRCPVFVVWLREAAT